MKAQTALISPASNARRRRWAWLAVGLGVSIATIWGWQHEPDSTQVAKHDATSRSNNAGSKAAPNDVAYVSLQTSPRRQTPTPHAREQPSEHEPDNAYHDERRHSHPIDEKRQRIYRENNLSFAMMGAMNVGDYTGLRALIEEYRTAYPEDEYQLQEGYSLVADCLERLTPERQNDAREYWQHNRGSVVRRFIRRHCLDKPSTPTTSG